MSEVIPIILITILLFIVAAGIIVFVLIYQKKQLQYISERKQLKASFEKEILGSRLEIQEQTMKSIAEEVHDNIGQMLSVVKLNLNMIKGDEPAALLKEKTEYIAGLLQKAIQDLRDLSRSLHSDIIIEKGFIKAIENEIEVLKKTGAYNVIFNLEGRYYPLTEQKELILFRMFQEIINNIIKHAKASEIDVQVIFLEQEFTLCIHDDGQGFNTAEIDAAKGIGLRNIINRSELIGAYYFIDSQPGKGTTIKISLPASSAVMLNS